MKSFTVLQTENIKNYLERTKKFSSNELKARKISTGVQTEITRVKGAFNRISKYVNSYVVSSSTNINISPAVEHRPLYKDRENESGLEGLSSRALSTIELNEELYDHALKYFPTLEEFFVEEQRAFFLELDRVFELVKKDESDIITLTSDNKKEGDDGHVYSPLSDVLGLVVELCSLNESHPDLHKLKLIGVNRQVLSLPEANVEYFPVATAATEKEVIAVLKEDGRNSITVAVPNSECRKRNKGWKSEIILNKKDVRRLSDEDRNIIHDTPLQAEVKLFVHEHVMSVKIENDWSVKNSPIVRAEKLESKIDVPYQEPSQDLLFE